MSTPRQTLTAQKSLDGMLANQFSNSDAIETPSAATGFGTISGKPATQDQRRQWRRRRIKRFG